MDQDYRWITYYGEIYNKDSFLPKLLGKGYIMSEFPVLKAENLDGFLQSVLDSIFVNYDGTIVSGVFITHLLGRQEYKGFRTFVEPTDHRKNTGIHYPGFDFDEIENQDLAGSPALKFEK
jgi:hypothetical protein